MGVGGRKRKEGKFCIILGPTYMWTHSRLSASLSHAGVGEPASGFEWHPHLCIAPTADGPSPVWDVDAVWVPDQPVVILGEIGARVLRHRAIHIVEHGRLVAIHVQLVEPGPRLSEEHSGSNLNRDQGNKAEPEGERKLQPSSGQGKVSNFR